MCTSSWYKKVNHTVPSHSVRLPCLCLPITVTLLQCHLTGLVPDMNLMNSFLWVGVETSCSGVRRQIKSRGAVTLKGQLFII